LSEVEVLLAVLDALLIDPAIRQGTAPHDLREGGVAPGGAIGHAGYAARGQAPAHCRVLSGERPGSREEEGCKACQSPSGRGDPLHEKLHLGFGFFLT
jgi:hypothetical protein